MSTGSSSPESENVASFEAIPVSQPNNTTTLGRIRQWLTHERLFALLSVFCAAASALAAFVSCWQANIQRVEGNLREERLDNQTREMIAYQSKMASSMETNAIYIKEGVEAAFRLSREEQRAWVWAKSFGLRELKAGDPPRVKVEFENVGKTPCRASLVGHYLLAEPPHVKGVKIVGGLDPQSVPMTSVLGSGGTSSGTITDKKLSGDEIMELLSGEKVLYVFGVIAYEDVYKKPHRTQFCVYLQFPEEVWHPVPSMNDFD